MMVPFLWMVSPRSRRGPRCSAPRRSPSRPGAHWENYATMWNALPGVTFGDFFLNSLKLAC